jgi:ADP-ribose pyrophosphatase YjhB (NUDIX family)
MINDLLNIYSYPGRPVVVIVFAAEVTGGILEAGDESLAVKTFKPEDIPWNELAFPSTRDALQDYINRYYT